MSLPPGFLDDLRTRLSLSQVVGRKVMWDAHKSNQAKGDMWAPCPFHQEKTASFHVDDRKGYYYCFGCHAKGDAISFVRETENVSFMEAVEILAGEAGMQMPARDPQAREKADRRSQLIEVMEQAVQYFRLQLKTGAGAAARDYLAGRGLSGAALDRWEIGFAPPGWQGLWDHLRAKGVAEDLILAAGLAKPSTKGGKPYDVFRNRIMFPIRDGRGRAIAFGGRAMDPEEGAKYLNSPQTELFDKGRNLYNHAPVRAAAGKGQPLIVAEGYMDVIALSEAGFEATVAPLGTAITEDQLQLLWRIHPEPVVALDGDRAGINAAMRLIDLALPLLEPGRALRFAIMPASQDPDDLIRAGGAGAMQKLLEAAQPMVELLWRRETEGKVFDSPERRSKLDADLRKAISRIPDAGLKRHYGEALNERRRALFQAGRDSGPARKGGWTPRNAPAKPVPTTLASPLVAAPPEFEDKLREALILATLVTHPVLLEEFEGDLERLELTGDDHTRIRGALLTHCGETDPDRMQAALAATLGPGPLETLFSASHLRIAPPLRDRADHDKAAQALREELDKLAARRGAARDVEEAVQDMQGLAHERLTWRLRQASEARARAGRGDTEDKGEYDIAPNGARLNRDERGAFDRLLDQIDPARRGKGA